MNVPFFSEEELERRAVEFLAANACHDGLSLHIELTIERFGIEIFSIPNLGTIANAFVPVVGRRIYIDEEQYQGIESPRYRFTLAEELAHFLIHRPFFDIMDPHQAVAFRDSILDRDYVRMERDAKYMAGCLLMPKDVFIQKFNDLHELRAGERNDLLKLDFVMRKLGFAFNVSKHSACIRALKLGLIDQNELDDLGF